MDGQPVRFDELRATVIECIREIHATHPAPQSIEWFLVRYLQRIVKRTEPPCRASQVEGTMRALIRFYVDNVDGRSELGRACLRIHETYRKTLRERQSGEA